MRKIAIICLDGLSAPLVDFMGDELSVFSELRENGVSGIVKSMIPGAKMVAWACAQTGQGPQVLDFWDDVYRDDFSYDISKPVDSHIYGSPEEVNYRRDPRDPFFRYLLKRGDKVAIIGVPGSWPVPRVTGGYCLSCSMAPGLDQGYTWPPSLHNEISESFGDYVLDVPLTDARPGSQEFSACVESIRDMDEQRFGLLNHFLANKQCDTLMLGVSGPGKMARLCHECFGPGGQIVDGRAESMAALRDYYLFLDESIGEVREVIDQDTVIMLLSPHGIVKLDGQLRLNEWLVAEGYLNLKKAPAKPARLSPKNINWSKTKAWFQGRGGQLYLNVKGREKSGIVARKDLTGLANELVSALADLTDPDGNRIEAEVLRRDEAHPSDRTSFGPDLLVTVENHRWEISDEVGHDGQVAAPAPRGPAAIANGPDGYCSLFGPGLEAVGDRAEFQITDIAPTVLSIRGLAVPQYMEGKPFAEIRLTEEEREQKALEQRLNWLGY
jgi:predicted AlkP superfamily phosphohydrolase/phosphomutase